MTDSQEKTYVYEGKVWVVTGRIAKRPIFSKRDPDKQLGVKSILEIAPLNGGGDPDYNKWVDPRELYYISVDDNIDVEKLKLDNEGADE